MFGMCICMWAGCSLSLSVCVWPNMMCDTKPSPIQIVCIILTMLICTSMCAFHMHTIYVYAWHSIVLLSNLYVWRMWNVIYSCSERVFPSESAC